MGERSPGGLEGQWEKGFGMVQAVALDRQGVPSEETPRRLRTRKVPGQGLGRLYGTVVPRPKLRLRGRFLDLPRNLTRPQWQHRAVETAQSLTDVLSGGTAGGPSLLIPHPPARIPYGE